MDFSFSMSCKTVEYDLIPLLQVMSMSVLLMLNMVINPHSDITRLISVNTDPGSVRATLRHTM
jgi:hypothetical protein